MTPGIDMSDRNAWDDSLLIDSWNDAVTEYKKYHSIHKSGKKLEDVLSAEELKDLREDHGDLIEEAEAVCKEVNTNGNADGEDTEMPFPHSHAVETPEDAHIQPQESKASGQQPQGELPTADTSIPHDGGLAAALPQALLGTVQDENLKNVMISWYYAGYYTGLHTGQQQALKDASVTKR